MMRTTVNLPGDVYRIAREVAHVRDISLGDAIAELVRQGLNPRGLSAQGFDPSDRLDFSGPFPKFKVPPGAEPITLDQLLAAEGDL
jgi:hypothetical protein